MLGKIVWLALFLYENDLKIVPFGIYRMENSNGIRCAVIFFDGNAFLFNIPVR